MGIFYPEIPEIPENLENPGNLENPEGMMMSDE